MVDHTSNNGQLDTEHDLQDQLTDLWEIIHRHFGLALASLGIILGLGGLYYLKAPRTYESQADVVITSKQNAGFSKVDDERPLFEKSIETHALQIQSPLIVEQALQKYDLGNLTTLVDEEDPVAFVIENLSVVLKDDKATVLNIAYRCGAPGDARDVVSAIASTYQDYLGSVNEQGGRKATKLIEEGQELLKKEMVRAQQEYREFQRSENLMYRDNLAINPHHERLNLFESARQKFMVDKTVVEAKIKSLEEALAMGGPNREAATMVAKAELRADTGRNDLV